MPKLYGKGTNGARSTAGRQMHLAKNRDKSLYQSCKFGSGGSTQNAHHVTYWAGLRVEGGLSPFGKSPDDLTKWNDKIMNGGLFEKIGSNLK